MLIGIGNYFGLIAVTRKKKNPANIHYSPGSLGPLLRLNIGQYVLHFLIYSKQVLVFLLQIIAKSCQGYRVYLTKIASVRGKLDM